MNQEIDSKIGISGFTIVRNAEVLDYPFLESVRSVLPLCSEFIINCGESSDGTEALCKQLETESGGKVKLVHSKWDHQDQKDGLQLKAQTDTTMAYCREKWCLYIQADEVFHEADYGNIQKALVLANMNEAIDGVLFDYVHFYASYQHVISARNWYRHEVRLFKNNRGIAAFKDAQGFRKKDQPLQVVRSGARVFHYGYVKTHESLRTKTNELARWWGEDPKKDARQAGIKRRVGIKKFRGKHPAVMKERIAAFKPVDLSACKRVWDRRELKNLISLWWEKVFRFRIGEFRNYRVFRV